MNELLVFMCVVCVFSAFEFLYYAEGLGQHFSKLGHVVCAVSVVCLLSAAWSFARDLLFDGQAYEPLTWGMAFGIAGALLKTLVFIGVSLERTKFRDSGFLWVNEAVE
jgi:hypothetical protein